MPAATGPASPIRGCHLACGGATLTARARMLDVADPDRQVASQAIAVVPPGASAAVALVLDSHPLRQPFLRGTAVRDASATGWACASATNGSAYVYVVMTCAQSPSRPACSGVSREWVRLCDTHGRALNAGFPRNGPRTPALMKRLGLGGALADGVSRSDVAEQAGTPPHFQVRRALPAHLTCIHFSCQLLLTREIEERDS